MKTAKTASSKSSTKQDKFYPDTSAKDSALEKELRKVLGEKMEEAKVTARAALKEIMDVAKNQFVGAGKVARGALRILSDNGYNSNDVLDAIYAHFLEIALKCIAARKPVKLPDTGYTVITQMAPTHACEAKVYFRSLDAIIEKRSADEGDELDKSKWEEDVEDGKGKDEGKNDDGYAKAGIVTTSSEYVGQYLALSADCMREAAKSIAAHFKLKQGTAQEYIRKTIRHQATLAKFTQKNEDDGEEKTGYLSKEQSEKHIKNFCCKTALLLTTQAVDKQFHLLSEEQEDMVCMMSSNERVVLAICAMNADLRDLIEMSHEDRLKLLRIMMSAGYGFMRPRYTVAGVKAKAAADAADAAAGIQKPRRGRGAGVQVQQPEALEPVQVLEAPAHEQEQEPVQARQPDQVPVQMPELPEQPQPQPEPEPEPAPMPKPTPEPAPARLAEQLELFAAEVADAAIARARKRAKRTTAPAPAQGWVQEQLALDLCSSELADAAIAQAKASASAELVRVMARARDRVKERIADAELRCKADQTRAPPRRRRKRKGVAMAAH